MSVLIRIENLGKRYRLGEIDVDTLHEEIARGWATLRGRDWNKQQVDDLASRNDESYFWPLRHLNLEVNEGDVVGILGGNGAGKSTLLKLLSRITAPTEGRIRARGRISSLLEVGTGFNPQLTGIENIYLNGAIMGMRKSEIKRKIEQIVDFSGCEQHINTPVKRYSSGMVVRLGFSVAAHLENEILIVDEVLAVGDNEFQRKSTEKLKTLAELEGRTVLFVSHNLATVRNLCKSGVLIRQGNAVQYNSIADAILQYSSDTELGKLKYYFPKRNSPTIVEVSLNENELEQHSIQIEIDFESPILLEPRAGIIIYNEEMHPIFSSNMAIHPIKAEIPKLLEGRLICRCYKPPLRSGTYTVSIWLSDEKHDYDIKENLIKFALTKADDAINLPVKEYGSIDLLGEWSVLT